jgi:hypothetical protein
MIGSLDKENVESLDFIGNAVVENERGRDEKLFSFLSEEAKVREVRKVVELLLKKLGLKILEENAKENKENIA